jgi:hypothetical protein
MDCIRLLRSLSLGWLWLAAVGAWAHGGGLNAEGCHNNRKTGDYHCHRAPAVVAAPTVSERPSGSTAQALASQPSRPPTPTCHVGPRGGTYTLTKSGRKNYGGC